MLPLTSVSSIVLVTMVTRPTSERSEILHALFHITAEGGMKSILTALYINHFGHFSMKRGYPNIDLFLSVTNQFCF